MGWQDREYAQPRSFGDWPSYGEGLRRVRENIVTTLIVINVAIYVLTTLTGGPDASPVFRFMDLRTSSVQGGEVWRILTAQYLHWSVGHLFMNMLGLYFLGKPLAHDWGVRQFIAVYTIAGLAGNLFFVALTSARWLEYDSIAAGASGCVLGLLGAAAVRYPHAQILVYFLFPVKIRTVALLFAGMYVLNLISRGANAGGDACHIAGLAFGALWAFRGEAWWRRTRLRSPTVRRGAPSAPVASYKQRTEQRRVDEETVDRILKKVYEGGINSLSEAEKSMLRDATERQRAAESGRLD